MTYLWDLNCVLHANTITIKLSKGTRKRIMYNNLYWVKCVDCGKFFEFYQENFNGLSLSGVCSKCKEALENVRI